MALGKVNTLKLTNHRLWWGHHMEGESGWSGGAEEKDPEEMRVVEG